jgi:hypothetical protein
MAARDHIAKLDPDAAPDEDDLSRTLGQSHDVLIDMLRDRLERVVDALLRYKLGPEYDQSAMLDALFDLYDEGLLTKAEIRRRGGLEPEAFYDGLHAYRRRNAS